MKKIARILIIILLFATNGHAAVLYTPGNVPNPQLLGGTRFTANPDAILAENTVAEIDKMCLNLKERGIAQVAVVVVGEVDDDALPMFAHNLLNKWGVGERGKENGLVIFVTTGAREIEFETGYGLEGVLPDALCKRIQTRYMVPLLGEGKWDEGVLAGVRATYDVLTGAAGELGGVTTQHESTDWSSLAMMLGAIVLFVIVALWYERRKLTCPVCHTVNGLKLIKTEVVSRTRNSITRDRSYKCRKCGHIVKRRSTDHRGGGGIIIGGGSMGGFGGFGGGRSGGFGGGFGGGMSGGGGARSGF
jgi:uncharacterized protein